MVETSTLDLLLQYAYGELNRSEAEQLEYKLMDDTKVQKEAAELKEMMSLLDSALIAPEQKGEALLW